MTHTLIPEIEFKMESNDDLFSFFESDDLAHDNISDSNSDFSSGLSPFSSPLRSDAADFMLLSGSPEPEIDPTRALEFIQPEVLDMIQPKMEPNTNTLHSTVTINIPAPQMPIARTDTKSEKAQTKSNKTGKPAVIKPQKNNRKLCEGISNGKKRPNMTTNTATPASIPSTNTNNTAWKVPGKNGPLSLSREDLLQLTSKAFENYIRQVLSVRKLSQDEMDQLKKQRRLIKNRESAQLSRNRKKIHVDEIESKLNTLVTERDAANRQLAIVSMERDKLKQELAALRAATSTTCNNNATTASSIRQDAPTVVMKI